jgi:hypothetical protein
MLSFDGALRAAPISALAPHMGRRLCGNAAGVEHDPWLRRAVVSAVVTCLFDLQEIRLIDALAIRAARILCHIASNRQEITDRLTLSDAN